MHKSLADFVSDNFKAKDRILFTVLNWGLGHASRSIPLIKELIKIGCEIAIASDGNALKLLRREFPTSKTYMLAAYDVHYAHRSMVLNLFRQSPRLMFAIREEKKQTAKIVKEFGASIIIADNRYGTFHKNCLNYFICHQIGIQSSSKTLNKILRKVHTSFINRFDVCWIPDYNNNSLAGEISYSQGLKKFAYIGPLSRMKSQKMKTCFDIAIILSGPEPQRSFLEEILLKIFKELNYKIAFVRGVEDNPLELTNNKIKIFDLLESDQLNKIINQSKLVICRAGYSSIMDLTKLNQRAILIPTPGQTEQIYLSEHLRSKPLFTSIKQSKLTHKLPPALNSILGY